MENGGVPDEPVPRVNENGGKMASMKLQILSGAAFVIRLRWSGRSVLNGLFNYRSGAHSAAAGSSVEKSPWSRIDPEMIRVLWRVYHTDVTLLACRNIIQNKLLLGTYVSNPHFDADSGLLYAHSTTFRSVLSQHHRLLIRTGIWCASRLIQST